MTGCISHIRLTAKEGVDPAVLLHATTGASVVMVIDPAIGATAAAMARAAVPTIALERASHTRINAVAPGDRADSTAIDRAVAFLHGSPAITGQVLDIT